MAKERLSQLQKFILIKALENERNCLPGTRYIAENFWGKEKVHAECIKWHSWHLLNHPRCIGDQFSVSISRAKRRLVEKGLLHEASWIWRRFVLELTEEGREKAKSLMLISGGLNNKNERLRAVGINNKKETSDDVR